MARMSEDTVEAYCTCVLPTLFGVVALYAVACLAPAIYVDDGKSTSDLDFKTGSPPGLMILLFGWSGGNNGIPWSANVFLAIGLVALVAARFRAAFLIGSVAAILGLTTWWVWGFRHL